MADVFISYAREDRAKAEHLAKGLSALGLESFWDSEIPPGQTWADYIEGKLGQCKAVIVLWSEHSTKSQWVREEARMGREKAKLIPVMLDASPPPFGFGEVQAADLSHWNGDYAQPEWTRFAQAVHMTARGAAAPQPQAAPAPQPAPPPQPAWTQPTPAATSSGWRGQGAASDRHSAIEYVKKCFRLYFDGKGRARRSEYWWWVAFVVLISIIAAVLDYSFGVDPYTGEANSRIISMLAGVALLAPGVSVTARRLHDVGLSGWLVAAFFGGYVLSGMIFGAGMAAAISSGDGSLMSLAALVFLAAGAAQVVIALLPSKPGANQYGPNPKGA